MKKILAIITLFVGLNGVSNAQYAYEVTMSTFSMASLAVTSGTAVLVNPPSTTVGIKFYSASIYNIDASSAVYALGTSSTSAPGSFSCTASPLIGGGTNVLPYVITEKFEGLYMWIKSCSDSAPINMRRVLRGR